MRVFLIAVFTLSIAVVSGSKSRAGEERTAGVQVTKETVTSMAETFVTRHHEAGASGKPRLSFQEADVYRQDTPGKWAVLGGYMSFSSGQSPSPHAFGLTMQLTCPRPDEPKCWRLEKLLIDKQLIVDK